MKLFLLLSMIFCHIADDYYLQGLLASLKQKKWWEENAPDEKYKNDYKIALAEHAVSWAFVMELPVMLWLIYNGTTEGKYMLVFGILFVVNSVIHGTVDHWKANRLKINLIQDQTMHFVQIFVTWLVWVLML